MLLTMFPALLITDYSKKDFVITLNGVDERITCAQKFSSDGLRYVLDEV
jgi:hypothetical protein